MSIHHQNPHDRQGDATNAPPIGKDQPDADGFAKSSAELVDKYLLSQEPEVIILFLLVLSIIGIAGIDNYLGRLETVGDLRFLLLKIAFVVVSVLGVCAIFSIFRFLKSRFF